MKRLYIILLIAASCPLVAVNAQLYYHNPVVDYSLPDPSVIRGDDGYYYLYATEDIRNIPIHRSKDLVQWEYTGTVFTDKTRLLLNPREDYGLRI